MMKRLLAICALLILLSGVGQQATAQETATLSSAPGIHERLVANGVGSRLKLTLDDSSKVNGTLTAIHPENFEVTPKGAAAPMTLRYQDVSAMDVHEPRSSLGSRFKMGPCVGPISLAIASPFILVAWATGH